METLVVKNFLVIKDASLDVKKFNIIIGSQGTGKSVLAKTLYLLKNLENLIKVNLVKESSYENLNKEIKNKFISIFPEYAWRLQNFEIIYKNRDISITINNRDNLNIIFSDNLVDDYNKIINRFHVIKKNIDNEDIDKSDNDEILNFLPKSIVYRRHISKLLNDSNFLPLMPTSHFIPASRIFFFIL
ncbi:MAG: AAA family ATPase [Acinetobacter sp.]